VADLFDASHQTMLQLLCRCFIHSDETEEEVTTLVGTAVRLMSGCCGRWGRY
jgi:hypothetical protein